MRFIDLVDLQPIKKQHNRILVNVDSIMWLQQEDGIVYLRMSDSTNLWVMGSIDEILTKIRVQTES